VFVHHRPMVSSLYSQPCLDLSYSKVKRVDLGGEPIWAPSKFYYCQEQNVGAIVEG
jgi:hypothetical protein